MLPAECSSFYVVDIENMFIKDMVILVYRIIKNFLKNTM